MREENNMSFNEKNKFGYAVIRTVKDNIINSKEPVYNPIVLMGLDKGLRYRIFMSIFNKEFNRDYKGTYMYSSCDKLDLDTMKDKRLVIVENIDLSNNHETLRNKINELLTVCLAKKIQVILCSNVDTKELEIDEILKSKMRLGLAIYLQR